VIYDLKRLVYIFGDLFLIYVGKIEYNLLVIVKNMKIIIIIGKNFYSSASHVGIYRHGNYT